MKKLLLAASLMLLIPTLSHAAFDAKNQPKECKPTIEAIFKDHGKKLESFKNNQESLKKFVSKFTQHQGQEIWNACKLKEAGYGDMVAKGTMGAMGDDDGALLSPFAVAVITTIIIIMLA